MDIVYTLSPDDFKILEDVAPLLTGSEEGQMTNAIYRSPAALFRYAADQIEHKDKVIHAFKVLMQKLRNMNPHNG